MHLSFVQRHLNTIKNFVNKHKVFASLIPVAIVSLIMFRFFYNVDVKVLGNDIMAHIYKVWLLSKQISNPLLKWPYWGSWDQNWYCGYPFLGLYGPLFYYLSATATLLFNLSPVDAIRLVTFVAYPLSALIMFFCSFRLTKNSVCSVISSVAYATTPAFITSLTVCGNPTLLLGFVFFPLSFVFVERLLLKEGESGLNFIVASLSLALTVLSAYRNGLAYVFSIFIFLSFSYIFFRKSSILAFLVIPTTILLSSAFTVPALVYGMSIADISFRWVEPLSKLPLWILSFLIPNDYLSLGIPLFIFGLILPIRLIFRHFHKGISPENQRMFLYILCALILLVLSFSFVIPFHENIPIINNLTQGSTIAALSFFTSLLCGLYLSSLDDNITVPRVKLGEKWKKTTLLVAAMILVLIQAEASFVYHPPTPDRYEDAYNYIEKHNEGWFRVFQVPRQPTVGAIPMQTGVGTMDGWFDQGATKGVEYFILKMMGFANPKSRPFGWGTFYDAPDEALNALRIFNVKYVIVDPADPVFPKNVSKTIYLNLRSSNLVDLVAGHGRPRYRADPTEGICVFRLKEYYPVIVTQQAFVINSTEELPTFYEVVISTAFDPESAIFLSKDNDLEKIPWIAWNNTYSSEEHVNFTIHGLNVTDLTANLQIEIDRASFLYIPISCFPNLKTTVNGAETKVLRALPDFISVYLPSEGVHHIEIARQMTTMETTSLFLSFSTLVVITLVFVVGKIHSFVKKSLRTSVTVKTEKHRKELQW